jgi:hypothetical protein
MNPTLPVKSLHGTSWHSLCEDYDNARVAVEQAADVISKIEFNQRDYAGDDWSKAVDERKAMFNHLRVVREYLMAHALHVA